MNRDEIAEAKAESAEEQADRAKALKRTINDAWSDAESGDDITFTLSDEEAENLIVQLAAARSHWEDHAEHYWSEVQDRDE